jgi:hypothetical protein
MSNQLLLTKMEELICKMLERINEKMDSQAGQVPAKAV